MKTIFVGGSPRSGTSLLQRIVCSADRTSPRLKEAGYFRMLIQSYQFALADFGGDTGDYFSSPGELRDFHGAIASLFLNRTMARHPGIEQLVLKEPQLTMHFPALHDLFPSALFVITLRNPVDTIASMLEVGRKMKEMGEKHFFQNKNLSQLCNHYKSFYAPALNHDSRSFRERLLILRYEDIVLRPEVTLKKLAAFIGAQPHPERLRSQTTEARFQNSRYQAWRTSLSQGEISNQSVGAGKAVLNENEIKEIDEWCEDINHLFYPDRASFFAVK